MHIIFPIYAETKNQYPVIQGIVLLKSLTLSKLARYSLEIFTAIIKKSINIKILYIQLILIKTADFFTNRSNATTSTISLTIILKSQSCKITFILLKYATILLMYLLSLKQGVSIIMCKWNSLPLSSLNQNNTLKLF